MGSNANVKEQTRGVGRSATRAILGWHNFWRPDGAKKSSVRKRRLNRRSEYKKNGSKEATKAVSYSSSVSNSFFKVLDMTSCLRRSLTSITMRKFNSLARVKASAHDGTNTEPAKKAG